MHTAPKNKVRAIFHWSQLFMKSEQHECGISTQRGIEPTFLDLSFLPVKQLAVANIKLLKMMKNNNSLPSKQVFKTFLLRRKNWLKVR